MRRIHFALLLILVSILLNGCLYPNDKNVIRIPDEQQIQDVQNAINAYRKDHDGLLPIKNKDDETDYFIKYLIDFKRLVPLYLSKIPDNAFENGGVFQYVILHPDTNPTVKVFDLRIAEKIREIKFRLSTKEYPPFKDVIGKNAFTLEYGKLGYKEEPIIVSPFTGENLSFFITGQGDVYVDYSHDIEIYREKVDYQKFQDGSDIRFILAENSIFVPAYSLPYTINQSGELVFMEKNKNLE